MQQAEDIIPPVKPRKQQDYDNEITGERTENTPFRRASGGRMDQLDTQCQWSNPEQRHSNTKVEHIYLELLPS